MAIELDHEFIPGIILNGTYFMIGDMVIGVFDETMRVHFRAYLNEEARRQIPQQGEVSELAAAKEAGASEGQLELIRQKWTRYLRPLNGRDEYAVNITHDDYMERIKPKMAELLAEIYAIAKERTEPFGLANHFAQGKDV